MLILYTTKSSYEVINLIYPVEIHTYSTWTARLKDTDIKIWHTPGYVYKQTDYPKPRSTVNALVWHG